MGENYIIFKEIIQMKRCMKCKLEKPESNFYHNAKMDDCLDFYCKSCRNEQTKRYAKKNNYVYVKGYAQQKKEIVESLKSPCEKCGEQRLYLIQFHHVDPKEKSFIISTHYSKSMLSILNEIGKCVCLCSNCHDEFHHFYGKRPEHPVEALEEYLGKEL